MMFCAKCGKDLPKGTKFCGGCGEKMDSSSVESVPETVEETVEETPVLQQPTYVPPQPAYAAPQPSYVSQPPTYTAPQSYQQGVEPLSVGNYIGTLILLGIPLVNFILVLIWAFDSSTNMNKRNLARAILILSIIGIVLGIIFWGVIISILGGIFR